MQQVWENRRDESGQCKNCPGCESPYPLGGLGSTDADVMLVGQEPAYNVDDDKVTMDVSWEAAKAQLIHDRRESMNPLWKHMMNVALAARCSPEDLYFTNIAKCASGDFDERVSHCKDYFVTEFATVDPEVILLHGGKVIRKVLPMFGHDTPSSIGDVNGEIIHAESVDLVPLYHWGYAYRQGNIDEYNSDVADAVQNALRGDT